MNSKILIQFAVCAVLLNSNYNRINAEVSDLESPSVIDLTCTEDNDCTSFFQTVDITTRCYNNECACFDSRNTTVVCKPANTKPIKNLIGDSCPCLVKNSICNLRNNTCMCDNDYSSSEDRSNCIGIVRNYTVTGECDSDQLCVERYGLHSSCDMETNTCHCSTNYTMSENRCVSVFTDRADHCESDADCTAKQNRTVCNIATKVCQCKSGYIFVNATKECLPISTYGQSCSDSDDCRMATGNGICKNSKCECDSDHYKHTIKGKGIRCIKKIFVNDNCAKNTDCFETNRRHQVMECLNGKCSCLPNYIITNESRCESGSMRSVGTNLTLLIVLSSLLFIFEIIRFSN